MYLDEFHASKCHILFEFSSHIDKHIFDEWVCLFVLHCALASRDVFKPKIMFVE